MQVAIIIDVAFIVVVFLFVSLVGPDFHIEGGGSLLEFRDPLSLMRKTENLSAENREAIQRQCVPPQVHRGVQIEDRKNFLRQKFIRRFPRVTVADG